MSNLVWSIALAAVGILGIYLAGSKNLLGWLVSFAAQAAWMVFALVTGQYGFILSALAYGFVYGRNYLRWRRERPAAPTPENVLALHVNCRCSISPMTSLEDVMSELSITEDDIEHA